MKEIKIETDYIKLDAFMKWASMVNNGAEAKMYIYDGNVLVNENVETRRGRKLFKNDIVEFDEECYKLV